MISFFQIPIDILIVVICVLAYLPLHFKFFHDRSIKLVAITGLQNPVIDTWFNYPSKQATDLLKRLGPEGRHYYAFTELTIDLVFPVVYSVGISALLFFIWRHAAPVIPLAQKTYLMPFIVMALDYTENVCIVTMCTFFPNQPAVLPAITSMVTTVKILLLCVCGLLILIGLGVWAFH